mgnify:CR=1 FL=1
MNWKPLGDQVLLKVEKKTEKTKSGIILVDDTVYVYKSNLGENKEIVLDDEHFVLVRESEIAVVND